MYSKFHLRKKYFFIKKYYLENFIKFIEVIKLKINFYNFRELFMKNINLN